MSKIETLIIVLIVTSVAYSTVVVLDLNTVKPNVVKMLNNK